MKRKLLINDSESFAEIIRQIENAQKSIFVCMFIWRDDYIGNLIAEKLIEAADRGVKVNILKDKSGASFEKVEKKKQSFFHKKTNVKMAIKEFVLSFLYYKDNKRSKKQFVNQNLYKMLFHDNISVNYNEKRNDHSKYFIFDNRVLIMGGMNIGDKQLTKSDNKYRDYMIKFEDRKLVTNFRERINGYNSQKGFKDVEFFFNLKDKNIYEIKPKVLKLLDKAKYRVDIEMAYFGDRDITDKIIEISRKGINVSIITSREANVQQDLNQKVMKRIINNSNVKVYLAETMIHSKLMCIDRNKFFLGSANFHKIGMERLSELNVLVKNGNDLYKKWIDWREQLHQECYLVSEDNELDYNRLIALTEMVFC